MKIEILHESEHYVLIKPPLLPDGRKPRQEETLPLLEALRREHGLKFLYVDNRPYHQPAVLCERMRSPDPLDDDGQALRLAVERRLVVDCYEGEVVGPQSVERFDPADMQAARNAIVRAAATGT